MALVLAEPTLKSVELGFIRRPVLGRKVRNQLVSVVVALLFAAAMAPLFSLLWTVVSRGVARFDLTFLTNSMRGVVGVGGGALHAITGTGLITAATVFISVPIGVMAAIYLVEYRRGAFAKTLTFLVDVMTGIPSIVAGLFAYAVFSMLLGPGTRSGIAAAVALSLLMIPVVIRSSEEMLRLVPDELREASLALGVPKYRTIWKVVLPTAATGIVSGVMLGIARIVGEAAPLLLVAGFSDSMNNNLLSDRMTTLPVFIFSQWQNKGTNAEAYDDRAWTAALVLVGFVVILNLLSRLVAKVFAPKIR